MNRRMNRFVIIGDFLAGSFDTLAAKMPVVANDGEYFNSANVPVLEKQELVEGGVTKAVVIRLSEDTVLTPEELCYAQQLRGGLSDKVLEGDGLKLMRMLRELQNKEHHILSRLKLFFEACDLAMTFTVVPVEQTAVSMTETNCKPAVAQRDPNFEYRSIWRTYLYLLCSELQREANASDYEWASSVSRRLVDRIQWLHRDLAEQAMPYESAWDYNAQNIRLPNING